MGYTVTDDDGTPFWSLFQELGGVDALGYPITRRFTLDGFVGQAMQRLVLQWRPEARQVYFVNVLDVLSEWGNDDRLLISRQVPKPVAFSETGKSWEEAVATRLSLLEDRPAIREKYFLALGDPVAFNGLPTSRVTDMGNHYAIRTQRVVLQEWKEDVPWARKGQVTLALGGSLAQETGLIPDTALRPESPPPKVQNAPAQGLDSLDLQIAGSRLEDELALVLPYLRHPHVHLAIDPEFATKSPGEVIGSLDATQINAAQEQITNYLEQEGIKGRKILVVHQFDESMITRKPIAQGLPPDRSGH
ncbi:MAG TPA: hypothetical protein VJM51_01600, partial [Dehalococcoidia bacterium]|nr:hypothetical protein [Dehalococcoidia bacterium]